MKINFKKIHIHHFLSFDDTTVDLSDRGYCLVQGINKNPKDAAKSNGSGKSTIFNAISFALVGETLQGLKSNLANIYFNDGCYVELEFEVDNNKYRLVRSKDDKKLGTNLKVYINDEDKSGKGLRESQAVLDSYLPDLTSELIGSVIILGQGLPQKFTSNTPAGRKEVLEHLSKSDFMIQDLKERLEKRQNDLVNKYNEKENLCIKTTTEKTIYEKSLADEKELLDKLSTPTDFDKNINAKKKELEEYETIINEKANKVVKLNEEEASLNKIIIEQTNLKNDRLNEVYKQYVEYDKDLSKYKWDYERQIKSTEDEIKAMKEIKDVCPLCGQKIPNVIKPDTTQKEADLVVLKNRLDNILKEIEENNLDYNNIKKDIENKFNESTLKTKDSLNDINKNKKEYESIINSLGSSVNSLNVEIKSLEKDRDSHNQKVEDCKNKIKELEIKLSDNKKVEDKINKDKKDINIHLEVVSKMNTLIKRDFRGILLQDIISFIDSKMKDYSKKIFDTNEIEMSLDGTNVDIKFCGKDYDNLSGGEKQRVDIIVQFAISDMMSTYLNFSSNILVLDEITDALDRVSCDKVINFITTELNRLSSIFIISHHSDELDIPTDSILTIVKNNLGISEVIY